MKQYLKPETPNGVRDLVSEFCKTWETFLPEYSFAHLVFEHMAFDNKTIDFCIAKAPEWYAAKQAEFKDENPMSAFYWERSHFTDWMNFTDEVIWFLRHLKSIPESVRDEAENLDD